MSEFDTKEYPITEPNQSDCDYFSFQKIVQPI